MCKKKKKAVCKNSYTCMCTVCVDSTHTSHIPFQHTEPPLPPRDRLQVPGPPRGPRRALVRSGAIQAAPNTQPWVLCVSLTALVISLHVVVGKKKEKKEKRRTSGIIALKNLTEPQGWDSPYTFVSFKGLYQCFLPICNKSHIPAFHLPKSMLECYLVTFSRQACILIDFHKLLKSTCGDLKDVIRTF